MNKLTIVLTLSSLTAALTSPNFTNPTLADTSTLDQGVVAQATAPGQTLTTDEQNLFAAINAAREANGLPDFTLDPALIEPARYEIMEQAKTGAGGEIVLLADGVTSVPVTTLVSDFGANTNGVRDDVFDNFNFEYDTPVYTSTSTVQTDASGGLAINWNGPPTLRAQTNLMTDWQDYDPLIVRFLTTTAYTRIGLGTVRTGTFNYRFGDIPLIRWCVIAGKGNVTTPPVVITPPVVVTPPPVVVVTPPPPVVVVTPPPPVVVTPPPPVVVTPPPPVVVTPAPPVVVVTPPPTVATAATASQSTVTGTTVNLATLGAYAGGESTLTYTWAVKSGPSVTFTANGTNLAKNTSATFTQPGSYTFQVSISDAKNETVNSSVSITVSQTLTALAVTPGTATLKAGSSQQYSASGTDQFGSAMPVSPTWAVNTGGSISSAGLLTASASASGSYTVTATSGSVTASAGGSITAPPPPPPAAPPSLYSILSAKYDAGVVSEALAAGPTLTTDEQNLFAAINAAREANGLPDFTLDPALIEPARYEIMEQAKTGAGGEIVLLADGVTSVPVTTLVSDFGANTNGVRDDVFDNFNFEYDTPVYTSTSTVQTDASGGLAINWNGPPTLRAQTNLMTDWQDYDPLIVRFLTTTAYTRIGLGTVRTGTFNYRFGDIPLIRWCVIAGK